MATPYLISEITPLLSTKNLHPVQPWLHAFLSSQRPTTPLPALASTAAFRLLASDITTTLSVPPQAVLPADIQDARIKDRYLSGRSNVAASSSSGSVAIGSSQPVDAIIVQVLDVEDIGRSRWSQVEELEALERGEGTRGREIIRVSVPEVDGSEPGQDARTGAGGSGATAGATSLTTAAARKTSTGPHKVLLQDVKGQVVYGFELRPIDGINVEMSIGAKLMLKGCQVARGLVMLEPETVSWLGGKIEALHKEWTSRRKDALKATIEDQFAPNEP